MHRTWIAVLLLLFPAASRAQVPDTLTFALPLYEANPNTYNGTYDPCPASATLEHHLYQARLFRWYMGQPIPTVPIMIHTVAGQEGQTHMFVATGPNTPRTYCVTVVDSSLNESCRICVAVGPWPVAVEPDPDPPPHPSGMAWPAHPEVTLWFNIRGAMFAGADSVKLGTGIYWERGFVGGRSWTRKRVILR